MGRRRHLSVVRSPEEEHAAKAAALRQIGDRIPNRMRRTYDWQCDESEALFAAMTTYIADGSLTAPEIESMLDMDGLAGAFHDWLGERFA